MSSEKYKQLELLQERGVVNSLRVKAAIDLFAAALVAGNAQEAEKQRDVVMVIQGDIMDDISLQIRLMKELGMRLGV